ncbi:exported hypothetical protein [Frankia canadensis]|uniref:PDZ domain-containing protein n=1 Tax=Frankia canadensis TaxID=1836972 RepID=A0A2I2L004_9ACTN|nr:PDZ domain-containing protein [Frankia canadensis]SNQ51251.1 exported hypothetical protein [Frankia canadensis]SOU58541.1 exported hypothetical protein [Frankia canadensis]
MAVAAMAVALPVGVGLTAGAAQASPPSGSVSSAAGVTATSVSSAHPAIANVTAAGDGKGAPCPLPPDGIVHKTLPGSGGQPAGGAVHNEVFGAGGQSASAPALPAPEGAPVDGETVDGATFVAGGAGDGSGPVTRRNVVRAPAGEAGGTAEFGIATCDTHGGQVFAIHVGPPAGGGAPVLTIAQVQGGPAAAAGLRAGDVVQSIDGAAPIVNGKPDRKVIEKLLPPDSGTRTVHLVVHRPSTNRTWTVALTLQPPPGAPAGKPWIHRFVHPGAPGAPGGASGSDAPGSAQAVPAPPTLGG